MSKQENTGSEREWNKVPLPGYAPCVAERLSQSAVLRIYSSGSEKLTQFLQLVLSRAKPLRHDFLQEIDRGGCQFGRDF